MAGVPLTLRGALPQVVCYRRKLAENGNFTTNECVCGVTDPITCGPLIWQTKLLRRIAMSLSSHLVELKKKHDALSDEVEIAQRAPGTDGLQIAGMKKQKLKLKEEIERLSTAELT